MFNFNKWNISEPLELFLVKPDGTIVCQLNGIDENSASLTINLNNQYELSFDYFKYIDIDGHLVESNGYYDFSVEMEILVSNVGFFRMVQPPYKYDDNTDKVSISARSIDSVLENVDLNYFKINTGEKDSLEYLVEYEDGETEQLLDEYTGLPYDYIVFYNDFPSLLNELKNIYPDGVYSDADIVGELKKYLSLIPRLKHKFATINNSPTLVEYAIIDDNAGTITLQNFASRCTELQTFYTKYGKQLSLMHIVMDKIYNKNRQNSGDFCHAWSIGEIDDDLRHKRFQFDSDENIYSFLTQTVSQAANCVFMFDVMNMRISAKLIENIGSDSGVSISRKNLMNTLTINCDDEQLITRYEVSGGNDNDISSYNFGTNKIDDLSYFFNARNSQGKLIYVSDELATKYAKYIEDREKARPKYAEYTKQINQYTLDIDTIRLRVPNDILKTDYTTFKTEELEGLITTYNNTLAVLQTLYKEDYGVDGLNQDGSINEQFIRTTPYWYDYYAYLEAIEQVRKALVDRLSTVVDEDELAEQIDAYKTEWSLYGTVELNAIQNSYTDKLQLCIDGQSIIPKHYYKNWSEMTSAERAVYSDDEATFNATIPTWKTLTDLQKATYGNWEENYRYEAKQWSELSSVEKAEYGGLEANYYYDVYYADYLNRKSCHAYYVELQTTVDDLESDKSEIIAKRTALVEFLSLEGYSHEALANLLGWGNTTPDVQFSAKDIIVIKRLYIDNTYENNNIITTSIDDIVTSIEVAKELYEDATEQLSIVSQPQLTFETDIDNLLCLPEFKDYDFNPGNFIFLEYYDDYYIKVRLSSITFNPCIPTESLSVSFTNYITSNAERTDLTSILGLSKDGGSSGSSGGSGGSNSVSEIDNLSNTLIYKLLNSEEFGSRVTNVILDTIKVNQITAKFAKFDGLANGTTTIDGQCITTGYIRDSIYQSLVANNTITNGSIDNTTGSIINLNDGKFNLAGKIKWNGELLSVTGSITAQSGYLGTAESGFIIDSYGIYSGSKSGTTDGYITLSNNNFERTINGTLRNNLRFAIGANFAVSNSGALYSASGYIGKYQITSTYLITGTGSTCSGIGANQAFWAGSSSSDDAPFRVGYNGALTATSATITGAITATSGTIGASNATNKITIGTNATHASIYFGMSSLANTSNDGFYIGTDGIALGKGKFKVTSAGALTATSATITGAITATSGTIGGNATNKITIGTNSTNASIYSGMSSLNDTSNNGFYLGTDGIAFGKGTFKVTSAGVLTATSATITGIITATTLTATSSGTIGCWSIDSSKLYATTTEGLISATCELTKTHILLQGISGTPYLRVLAIGADGANGYNVSPNGIYYYSRNASFDTYVLRVRSYIGKYYATVVNAVGNEGIAVVTNTLDDDYVGKHISTLACGNSNTLRVRGEWGTEYDFDYRYVTTYSSASSAANASDIRLKKNIQFSNVNALEVLRKIKMYSFDWNVDNRGHQDIGFVADYIEKIDDKLVSGGGYNKNGDMNYKRINSFYLQGYEVKAIQELSQEIEVLKEKIKLLERK